MAENGRVDLIIKQLDRIERKLDDMSGRVSKVERDTHDRIAKVESRVSRIEVIGGMFQALWAGLISRLFGGE